MPQKDTLDRAAYTCMLVSYRRLSPQFQFSPSAVTLYYLSLWLAAGQLMSGQPGTVRNRQAVWPVHHLKQNDTCRVTLLQQARRAAVLGQTSTFCLISGPPSPSKLGRQPCWGYTHKTSGFKTSGFKTSGFKTSGFKTSGLQNVRFTKRQVQNVWFQNVQFLNLIYLLNKKV
jgi:hypothetical protein